MSDRKRKKPSGGEQRKRKLRKDEERNKLSDSLNSYLVEKDKEDESSALTTSRTNSEGNLSDSMFGAKGSSNSASSCPVKSAETFTPEPDMFPTGKCTVENPSATKAVPGCFKGTFVHLNVLPGCCPTLPPLQPTDKHSVMFKVPIVDGVCPQPDPTEYHDVWDSDHVHMPCSPENKYPNNGGTRSRWELIKDSLSQDIKSSYDLEETLRKYNAERASNWDFSGLHFFFKEHLNTDETENFFQSTLPAMIKLALSLPQICTQSIPLLKQHMNHSITFSQKQISCLLCNGFLCTFPREKASNKGKKPKGFIKYANYPDISFHKLFAGLKNSISSRKAEKLKCLINYFSRVTTEEPTGTVTFHRQYIQELPQWSLSQKNIKNVAVNSDGVIESDGFGMLQVDFADEFVGGIVLEHGCLQEEIRFVMCPELIISRLFTEVLGPAEVLLMSGAEQYNTYEGYGNSFLWKENFQDETPKDAWGRRCTRIVAMDALNLRNPTEQFKTECIERELNKAFSGFYDSEVPTENLPAVATGNWGCGVFRGNPHFKFLIQLMAASEAGRDIMYFTFYSGKLQQELETMYRLVVNKKLKVGGIWDLLLQYNINREELKKSKMTTFYDFVCSALSD